MPRWKIKFSDGSEDFVEAATKDQARRRTQVLLETPPYWRRSLGERMRSPLEPFKPSTAEAPQIAEQVAKRVVPPEAVEFFKPKTQTDLAIMTAFPAGRGIGSLLAKGRPLLQRVIGAAIPTATGAIASQAETGRALPGALQGAGGAALGALPAIGGYIGRATQWGRKQVLQSMERGVLAEMGKISPAFRGIKEAYRTIAVFPRAMQRQFSQMFEAGLKRAEALAPGPVVDSQTLHYIWTQLPKRSPTDLATWAALAPTAATKRFTVMQAQELLQMARAGAYRGARLATEKASSRAAQKLHQQARKEAYASLPPAAREAWEQTNILYGVNKALAAIFKESKSLKPSPMGPILDPNAALKYMEEAAEPLQRRLGQNAYWVLHSALSRGGRLGERHDLGTSELVPGILERSVVITRSLLKHLGVTPMKMAGTRPQPFISPTLEVATGMAGSQALGEPARRLTEPRR